MKHYHLRIRTKEERVNGKTLFPEFIAMPAEMELMAIGIDEKSTVCGKIGLVFVYKPSPDAQMMRVCTMTAAAFLTIADSIKEVMKRFGDEWEGV